MSAPRLGTRMRGQLAEAYGSRGHSRNNLWFAYSPKARADIVLRSDLEFGHHLLAESDPDIEFIDYAPAKRVAAFAGEAMASIVDAEVRLRTGETIWREIKTSENVEKDATSRVNLQVLMQMRAVEQVVTRHELLTEKEIFAYPQRIHNWLRIVPWLAQAREWSLHDFGIEVAAFLNAHHAVEFHEVLALGDGENNALYGAALLKGVQHGFYRSDLNEVPWSQKSRFMVLERR